MDDSHYAIRLARPDDVPLLPQIEWKAARILEGHLPHDILEDTSTLIELFEAQSADRLWVVTFTGEPVGFAHVMLLKSGSPHLDELGVLPEHGKRGLGTALVQTVLDWGRDREYPQITLTTFRDFAWNMPFYQRMGFEVLPDNQLDAELSEILRDEDSRGFDRNRRVAMRYTF